MLRNSVFEGCVLIQLIFNIFLLFVDPCFAMPHSLPVREMAAAV